jgi:hypothetical protein
MATKHVAGSPLLRHRGRVRADVSDVEVEGARQALFYSLR